MSVRFNAAGGQSEVSISGLSGVSNTSFTACVWVNVVSYSGSWSLVTLQEPSATPTENFQLINTGTNSNSIELETNRAASIADIVFAAVTAKWYFIAITCGPVNTIGYVFGPNNVTSVASQQFNSDTDGAPYKVSWGNNDANDTSIDAWFSSGKIWNRQLSQAELLQEIRQRAPYSKNGLVSYTPFRTVATMGVDEFNPANSWTVTGTSTNVPQLPPVPEFADSLLTGRRSISIPSQFGFGPWQPYQVPPAAVPPTANVAPNITEPEFPDFVARPSLSADDHMFFAMGPSPILNPVPNQQDVRFPEAVARPVLFVPAHLAAAAFAPRPERSFSAFDPEYPDSVARPAMPLVDQLGASEEEPQPEQSQFFKALYPDSVTRPALSLAIQLAATELAALPEQKGPSAGPEYPDWCARPALPPADQQYSMDVMPAPERTLSMAATFYPDRFPYPKTGAESQWVVPPEPERTSVPAFSFFPDAVARPALPVPEQLAETEEPPFTDRTLPLAWAEYPSTVARFPMPPSVWALYALPQPNAAPLTNWVPSFPDSVARPALAAALQFYALEKGTAIERNAPYWATVYPDTVARPALSSPEQMASGAEAPAPERNVPMFEPVYPASLPHPDIPPDWEAINELPIAVAAVLVQWLPTVPATVARLYPTSATPTVAAPPERNSPVWSVSYPDAVARPALPTHSQQFASEELPRPEETIELSAISYPTGFPLPRVPPSQWVPAPAPERTSLLAEPEFPSAVARPAILTGSHLTSTPPVTLFAPAQFFPQFPSSLPLVMAPAWAWTVATNPERTQALAEPEYPSLVWHPPYQVWRQDVFFFSPVITSPATFLAGSIRSEALLSGSIRSEA